MPMTGSMWVNDGDNRVYVYTGSGQRVADADFRLFTADPRGIAYANNRFYVVDFGNDKVYGHGSDGGRDSAGDFDFA